MMESSLQQNEGSENENENGAVEQVVVDPEAGGRGDLKAAKCADSTVPDFLVGKPQVWVRLRPSACCDNNIFEIADDNKKMRITIEPEDRIMQKKTGKTSIFQYCTDGILRDASQKETQKTLVSELVDKAMEGICGAFLCVGPEFAGKTFTLFGTLEKYKDRGMVFRALEEIFETIEATKHEKEYHIVLSMFEVRKDKIKDLITLGDYELRQVGEFGPKGLFYEEIFNMEQALILILRGLAGQKLFPREAWAKPHTIIYIDIICRHLHPGISQTTSDWRSRLTFVEIASMPQRDRPKQTYNVIKPQPAAQVHSQLNGWTYPSCPGGDPNLYAPEDLGFTARPQKQLALPMKEDRDISGGKGNCGCSKGGPSGALAESISIRKDFSYLEQMFVRAHDLRKIATYYAKLKSLGMYMLHQPPKLAPSQYFRQSRLAHCLKDIVTGKTEVRVVLHIRPEKEFIQSSLEAMRFAERARCIPCEAKKDGMSDDKAFEEQIASMCKELGMDDPSQVRGFPGGNSVGVAQLFPHIDGEKMKTIMTQATAHFEEKLDSLEGSCKEQVKNMFETFRDIWMRLLETSSQQALLQKEEQLREGEGEGEGIAPASTQTEGQTKDGSSKKKKDKKDKEKKEKGKKRRSSLNSFKVGKGKSKGGKKSDAEASTVALDELNSTADDLVVPTSPFPGETSASEEVKKPTETTDDQQLSSKEREESTKEAKKVESTVSLNDINKGRRKSSSNGKGRKSVTEPAPGAHANPDSGHPRKSAPAVLLETDPASKLVQENSEHEHESHPPNTPMDEVEETEMVPILPIHTEVTDEVKFKHEAWEGFKATEVGMKMLAEFADRQAEFREILVSHSEIQKEISNIVVKLTTDHAELDALEQERIFKGVGIGVTLSGTVVVPTPKEESLKAENETLEQTRDELVAQLNEVRNQLKINKQRVEDQKKECEVAFYDYFMEKYGRLPKIVSLPLSTMHQVSTASALEALGFSVVVSEEQTDQNAADKDLRRSILEQIMGEKYEDIKRIAKQQAKEILSYYPKRPPWSNV